MLTHLVSPVLLALCLSAPASSPSDAAAAIATGPSLSTSGPLVVTCPSSPYKVTCGQAYDPEAAGKPIADGGCPPYTLDYTDVSVTPQNCPAGRFDENVTRTWTITDACGNTQTCTQSIHILRKLVSLDLHPRSCPNPLERQANGRYPAAILGSATFDVTTIVPGSLQLYVLNCQGGGSVAPIPSMTRYEDVARPYDGGVECGCTTNGPDGYLDLTFKFDRPTLVQALGLNGYPAFSYVKLVIVGQLTDGCTFVGLDCVRVQ